MADPSSLENTVIHPPSLLPWVASGGIMGLAALQRRSACGWALLRKTWMERASGDHLEDDQARRRRVGRDAERLQRIGRAQEAYLTLRRIENQAGDAQGHLAAAAQQALGRHNTHIAARRYDRHP